MDLKVGVCTPCQIDALWRILSSCRRIASKSRDSKRTGGSTLGGATRSFQEVRWAPVRGRQVFFRVVTAAGEYFALSICHFLTSSGRFVVG